MDNTDEIVALIDKFYSNKPIDGLQMVQLTTPIIQQQINSFCGTEYTNNDFYHALLRMQFKYLVHTESSEIKWILWPVQ